MKLFIFRMEVGLREDLRRDGLMMNFLVDESLMLSLARAFPYSTINIGYPAICSSEQKICEKIAENLESLYSFKSLTHLSCATK